MINPTWSKFTYDKLCKSRFYDNFMHQSISIVLLCFKVGCICKLAALTQSTVPSCNTGSLACIFWDDCHSFEFTTVIFTLNAKFNVAFVQPLHSQCKAFTPICNFLCLIGLHSTTMDIIRINRKRLPKWTHKLYSNLMTYLFKFLHDLFKIFFIPFFLLQAPDVVNLLQNEASSFK